MKWGLITVISLSAHTCLWLMIRNRHKYSPSMPILAGRDLSTYQQVAGPSSFFSKKAPIHTPPCEGGQSMVQSANWSLIPCNQQAPLKLVLGAFFFPFELHWTGLYFLGADRVVVVFVVSYKVAATIIYLFLHARAQLPTISHRKELYIWWNVVGLLVVFWAVNGWLKQDHYWKRGSYI